MVSLTVRYALSAMTVVARRDPEVVPVSDLARELDLPPNYLAKTLDRLRSAGMVEGVRGRSGGFRLLRSPADVTLADIARIFDDDGPRGQCLMGREACADVGGCPLHAAWKAASSPAYAFLEEHTLADAAASPASWPPAARITDGESAA